MRIAVLVLAGTSLAFGSFPAAAQTTTRIETRPFYGAVVTIEEGVRVFHPLPPHDRIIIQPDNTASAAVQTGAPSSSGRNYIRTVPKADK